MDDETRIAEELRQIVTVLTDLTGLPSRWSGRVELVPEADFKGKKLFTCDIHIDATLAGQDERWPTLMHEAFHSLSSGYVGSDFRAFRGWEEGVVEQLQRVFCPAVLSQLNVIVSEDVFDPANRPFGPYIVALENLRRALGVSEAQDEMQRFYLDLLRTPLRDRSGMMMNLGLKGPQPLAYVQVFSSANAILRRRIEP